MLRGRSVERRSSRIFRGQFDAYFASNAALDGERALVWSGEGVPDAVGAVAGPQSQYAMCSGRGGASQAP
jgi:hypothetical protein